MVWDASHPTYWLYYAVFRHFPTVKNRVFFRWIFGYFSGENTGIFEGKAKQKSLYQSCKASDTGLKKGIKKDHFPVVKKMIPFLFESIFDCLLQPVDKSGIRPYAGALVQCFPFPALD